MRICSLLPSATEIALCARPGHRPCSRHARVRLPTGGPAKPRITRSEVNSEQLSSREIDALVTGHLHEHRGLYHLDRALLERLIQS